MAEDVFTINGSAASFAPYRQSWESYIMGRDHNGAPILSGFRSAILEFESCTSVLANQWMQFADTGTSVVSVNILNDMNTCLMSYSAVFVETVQRPRLEAGLVIGPWSLRISGIQP